MLFSELNRINLNVLIQDTDYEVLPDLNKCYVHNRTNWTIWRKKKYQVQNTEPENVLPLTNETEEAGWHIEEISATPEQNIYLNKAFTDISNSLIVMSEDKTVSTDYVKIYAGQFNIDGTLDYNALINNEDIFAPIRAPHFPHCGAWWTFNNGAFQWIGGGPKSIPECRFSYGPFCGPDPHHYDTNHKDIDKYLSLSKLPNLNFIFDEHHILKGIVSLPCATEQIKNDTKTFISQFIAFADSKFHQMSFKNLDEILKAYSYENAIIPTICVAHKYLPRPVDKPCKAIFELISKPYVLTPDVYQYIFPDNSNLNMFLNNSYWMKYSIDTFYGVGPFEEVTEILDYIHDLTEDNTLGDAFDTLNKFTDSVYKIYNNFNRVTLYTLLSEAKLLPLSDSDFNSSALMTLSDLFKSAKEIKELTKFDTENKLHVIVLPEKFCNKETLKFISNVRYVD